LALETRIKAANASYIRSSVVNEAWIRTGHWLQTQTLVLVLPSVPAHHWLGNMKDIGPVQTANACDTYPHWFSSEICG